MMDIVNNNFDIDDVHFTSELSYEDSNNNTCTNVERSNSTPSNMKKCNNIEFNNDKITPEEHVIDFWRIILLLLVVTKHIR